MKPLFILSCITLLFSCTPAEPENLNYVAPEEPLGLWMGMEKTSEPKLLAPDLLASSLDEYNSVFTPDGKRFFFTTNTPSQGVLCSTSMDEHGHWNTPEVLPFSGEHSEYDPLLTPDGTRLYFSSERPLNDSISDRTNVWYADIQSDGQFGILSPVALSGDGDYHSSVTADGRIFFNVWNNGDMFEAIPAEGSYRIERLPDNINSENGEGDPFILPDGNTLIYRGYNNTLGAGDLYITFRNEDGNWSDPKNLGKPINSNRHEMCPTVTPDGKFFIWSSSRILEGYQHKASQSIQETRDKHATADNGQLNLYYISADFIDAMRADITGQ